MRENEMEGKVVVAVGGCAILAGVAYIFQGQNRNDETRSGETPKLVPGLVNLGNTCYLSSVLQALASVTTFVVWLKTSCEQHNMSTGKKLTFKLSKLLQVLNSPCDEHDSYDPSSIFTTLYSHGWVITTEQQDAHEIFQVITSTLADEEEFASKKSWNDLLSEEASSADMTSDSIVHRSRVRASKLVRKSSSPFTGLFANQLFCKACSTKHSVKFDYFDTISLSLPDVTLQIKSCSLQGLLRKFVCSEIVESFQCDTCDKGAKQTNKPKRLLKKISLGKLPYCLCFHINRTYWQNNGTPYKNNIFVQFPDVFDISPFLYDSSDIVDALKCEIPNISLPTKLLVHGGSSQAPEEENTSCEKSDGKKVVQPRLATNTAYQLVAVIVHLGGVNEGHYVTFRKLGGSNGWVLISDEIVQLVPVSKVLNSNAYMLFYERSRTVQEK